MKDSSLVVGKMFWLRLFNKTRRFQLTIMCVYVCVVGAWDVWKGRWLEDSFLASETYGSKSFLGEELLESTPYVNALTIKLLDKMSAISHPTSYIRSETGGQIRFHLDGV